LGERQRPGRDPHEHDTSTHAKLTDAVLRATLVVKAGGRAFEATGALTEFASALRATAVGRATLVLHGGGAEVSTWSARFGVEPAFADGLRVTDPVTLEVAAAVLAGLANKRIVAALRAQGLDAVGLAGLDGGTVRARMHTNAAVLGAVGEVASIDTSLLLTLLASGRVPVLASLGDDGAGALLNLNADDVAAAIATALPARDLMLLSDTPGLKIGGAVVRTVAEHEIAALLEHPEVQGGMRPKLRAALASLQGGVGRVHICAWQGPLTLQSVLDGTGVATTFVAARHAHGIPEESHV
jgi:acetylglutamate kinase